MARKDLTNIQMTALEQVRSHPYFSKFEPRAYPAYENRKVDPIGYLEEVGIERVGEFVQFGITSIRIAAMLGISASILKKWITNNPDYAREIQVSKTFAAEEHVQEARDSINRAQDAFELSKASENAKQRRWEAERLDKDQYGSNQIKDKAGPDNLVIYNINLPELSGTQVTAKVIEKLPANTLDMKALFAEAELAE